MDSSKTVIAIYGASGTGKSSVARIASEKWSCPIRECGEEIKQHAKSLGIAFSDVSLPDHAKIDQATRTWISQHEKCVVEGRFLHHVLAEAGETKAIILIHLTAGATERAGRLSVRFGKEIRLADVHDLDEEDASFCARLYSGNVPLIARHVVDNSALNAEETFEVITSFLEVS